MDGPEKVDHKLWSTDKNTKQCTIQNAEKQTLSLSIMACSASARSRFNLKHSSALHQPNKSKALFFFSTPIINNSHPPSKTRLLLHSSSNAHFGFRLSQNTKLLSRGTITSKVNHTNRTVLYLNSCGFLSMECSLFFSIFLFHLDLIWVFIQIF